MKLKVTIEIRKINDDKDSYSSNTMYEQTKHFEDFDMMSVITAFNDAEESPKPKYYTIPTEPVDISKEASNDPSSS